MSTQMSSAAGARESADVLHAVERELESAVSRLGELDAARAAAEAQVRLLDAERRSTQAAVDSLRAILSEATSSVDAGPGLPTEPRTAALRVMSGAKLREMAARVALTRDALGREVHYLEWFAWLNEAGYTAGGKRPAATFLTQLGRSPIVRSGSGPGSYVLDLQPIEALECELRELEEELGKLPPSTQMSMAGDERKRRTRLRTQIERIERVLEEIWHVLAAVVPPGHDGPVETLRDAVRVWQGHVARRDQLTLAARDAETD